MATNAAGSRSAKRSAGKGRSSIGLWVILGSVLVVGLVLIVVALANRAPISAIEQPDVPAEDGLTGARWATPMPPSPSACGKIFSARPVNSGTLR